MAVKRATSTRAAEAAPQRIAAPVAAGTGRPVLSYQDANQYGCVQRTTDFNMGPTTASVLDRRVVAIRKEPCADE